MTTDANSSAAFYCPVHQVRFHAVAAETIQCDQAAHAVGYGFPNELLWTFCCACATFSPYEPTNHNSQLSECPVCERQVAQRCLCHSCKVITIESVALVHRKVHSIDSSGVKPFCPGCGSAPTQRVVQHDCSELGTSFLTARPSCEFCEVQISPNAQHHEASGISCGFCGAELIAPFRFCRKCGKAHAPAEIDQVQELLNEEPVETERVSAPTAELRDEPIPESPEPEATHTYSWDYSAAPAPRKRRTPWLIGGAASLLLVVILISVAVTNSNRTARTTETETQIPDPQTQAPPGMVYIGGGEFLMGNNAGDEYERPAHKVEVTPFYIDVTEVTCGEYLKFLAAKGPRHPENWSRQTCPPGAARRPVTGVNWNDAKSFADWAGKRLPTEEEWEFAARGVRSGLYPWGNEWQSNAANAGDSSAQRLMEVASYPNGRTPVGVMDLIGNAWEWTSSDVVVYPGGSLSSPTPQNVKVVRGGSWREASDQATGTYRGYLHTTDAEDYSATGFRCVKDIGPSPAAQTKP